MSSTVRVTDEGAELYLSFDDKMLHLRLADGRRADVPLTAYRRLATATREQLERWEVVGENEGIHWPDLDEDLSVKGLLAYR